MTPEFYPVKEGHKILLAKSPKDDPKLVYRQEVESRAQESQGAFSIFALRILEGKRQELNISLEEANAIKEEVLQPYREYERKRYEYEQTLIEAVKKHYPFSQVIQKEIKEYQQYLGLRDEDIAVIEQRVLVSKQAEYERQQEEERLKREQERAEYQEQLRQQEQVAQQRLQPEQEEAKSSQEFKYKLRRYKQEFVQAIEAKYPLNESIRNRLQSLQQLLELSDEDVALIEKPILDEREVEEQNKLQRRPRQQYQNETPRTQRQQYQENLRQKHQLRQQKQAKSSVNKNLSSHISKKPVQTQLSISRFIRICIGLGIGLWIGWVVALSIISVFPDFGDLAIIIGIFVGAVLAWYLAYKI
jgi:hypothetical protein